MLNTKYIIQETAVTAGGVLVFSLVPKGGGNVFNYKPGQYAMISFNDSENKLFINHPFSISSSPSQRRYLEFGIKIMGKFTQNLAKLPVGAEVNIMGPYGSFVFDEDKHNNAVFIAGGIGVTPFVSAIRYTTDHQLANQMTLLCSNRTLNSVTFYDEIIELSNRNSNFTPMIAITKELVDENNKYLKSGHITKDVIASYINRDIDQDFFICGPGEFMKAMKNHLLTLKISERRIHQEAFSMSPKLPLRENFGNLFFVSGLTVMLFVVFLYSIQTEYNKPAAVNNVMPITVKEIKTVPAVKSTPSVAQPKIVSPSVVVPKKNTPIAKPVTPVKTISQPTVQAPAPVVQQPSAPVQAPAATQPAPTPTTRVS